jgi:hypothetical protein
VAAGGATLRLQIGDYEGVRRRLSPLLPIFTDRYLTAVTQLDIADAGFAFGRAATLLASAHAHLGEPATAVRVVDGAKSLRLRYRAALGRHPARNEVVALERAILATGRAGEVAGVAPVTDPSVAGLDAGLPLRTRLLERYRRLRPELSQRLLASPSLQEVAGVLEGDEAVVLPCSW